MKSRRLIFKTHGAPREALQLEKFQTSDLKPGEVLLQIQAAPINPADLNYIEGTYGIKPELPATAGIECFGRVIESRSATFSEGENVLPVSKVGGWADHAIANEEDLLELPEDIDPLQAAMLKVNPATAMLLLTHFKTLKEGQWVALNASNSGVGQCVIQLAAHMGIRTACFVRDMSIAPELANLGATEVFEDSQTGFLNAKEVLGKEKAELAFNAVGGESALRIMKLLATGGTHITYGAMSLKPLTVPNGPLIFGDIRIRGLWVTKWMEECGRSELEETYRFLAGMVTSGTLNQSVDSTFELEEFTQAIERLSDSQRKGKVLFARNTEK